MDRTSRYHEQIVELARSYGHDASSAIEEWEERSAAREYLGGLTRDEAEFLAMGDLRERLRR